MTVVSHTKLYQRGFRDGLLQAERLSVACAVSLGQSPATANANYAIGADWVTLSLRTELTKLTSFEP